MITAKGTSYTIEFDGEIIRFSYNRIPGGGDVRVSTVIDTGWKDPGILPGYIQFILPEELIGERKVFSSGSQIPHINYHPGEWFGRKEVDSFLVLRDAVRKSIYDARQIAENFKVVLKPDYKLPLTSPETSRIEVNRNLHIGEIKREFDSQTAGLIQGTMAHELGFHGSFTGITIGQFGFGRGNLGLSGTTNVNLNTNSTTRSDFLNDSFVAIFDVPSQSLVPDTIRVIVPSEQACRELVLAWVQSVHEQMGLNRFGLNLV